jgi:putative ABC transport system permease protein
MRSVLRAFASSIRALVTWPRLGDDAQAECDTHIELLTESNIRAGMTRTDAHYAARRQFGNTTIVREDIYGLSTIGWLDSLAQDVRYACRGLRRSPGFTAVAVITLALGIGLNATVFTVTNAILFKGFRLINRNDRILYIGTQNNGRGCCASYPDFVDWRVQAAAFADMGAVADLQIALNDGTGAAAEHYDATQITTNAFRLLAQRPALGRDFVLADGQPGAAPVAILRYSFWERRYGKDPAIVGQAIRINGTPTTIIGIMPRDFSFPQNEDLWLPLVPTTDLDKRDARDLWFAFGRLADGATFEGARAELDTIGRRLAIAYPRTNQGWVPQPRTFAEFFVGRDAAVIYGAMWGAVGFVLLIACANLANLMLARAIGRAREMSIRVALGAGRWRIIRQLLIESLMLSSLGGVIAWWTAKWSVRAYELTANPPTRTWSDHLLDFNMDGRVFIYLLAISVAAALLFGLAPAIYISKLDVNGTLKDGGRGTGGGRRSKPLSGLLVIGEVALAVVLLAGAGVMVRSFLNISTAKLGVRTADITTMLLSLPQSRYRTAESQIAYFDRLSAQLQATAGVESIALAYALPGSSAKRLFCEIAGAPAVDDQYRPTVSALTIGPGYFTTLGAALRAGRDFNDFDRASGAPVAIVNQQFASTYWPGEDPLGKRLRMFQGTTPAAWLTVVGIVSNVVQSSDWQTHEPLVYRPYDQQPEREMWVIVRAHVPGARLATSFRREMHAIDADVPIWLGPFTLDDRLAGMGNHWIIGSNATLFSVFAAVALLLASIGLYAVVAYSVRRRTQEIGIRIAIGATARDILMLVFKEGMWPLGIGLTIGLAASIAVTPVLKTQLVRVSPVDPLTLVATSVVLILSATLGWLLPACRAMRVDPVVALRND